VNFVALLGWNPGDEREVFSPAELINEFSLERVGKSGAVFNVEKLDWINQQHLRLMDDAVVASELAKELAAANIPAPGADYLRSVVKLMKERVTTIPEFVTFGSYCFSDPAAYDEQARAKNWGPQSAAQISALADELAAQPGFTEADVEAALRRIAERSGVGAGKVIHATRLALTGRSVGPGLFELMVLLGRETTLRRLRTAASSLG
jgi:glutamyl-tRNA synthetase